MAACFDQDSRTARALRDVADYDWTLHNPGEWLCESPAGLAYLVSETFCTCPDFEHRASPAGGLCKHQVALAHRLLAFLPAEETLPQAAAAQRAAERAREEAEFTRIFG
jgi:hypothetical protein